MSRLKVRVPGRYERPAALRPPLGDRATEAGVRAGYLQAVKTNTDAARRAAVATVESATTVERVDLVEAGGCVTESPRKAGAGKVIPVDIIRSGWNSSGSRYYPAEVLERDMPKVYPKGTHMFIDHPSDDERSARPERSLTTLAAVFLDDPHPVREGDQVVMRTTARVFAPWQGFIAEAWEHIGVSINGSGEGEFGEREGRSGLVLEALTHGQSVDFVTRPGAGGRILGLLESARDASAEIVATREAGSLGGYLESRIHLGFTQLADDLYGHGRLTRDERVILSGAVGDALGAFVGKVEADAPQLYKRERWADAGGATAVSEAATVEATAEQTRMTIDRAVQAAYGGDRRYAWVQDYDPDAGLVWFAAGHTDEPTKTWQQAYTRDGATVSLTGERTEVRPRTVYEPVGATKTTESGTEPEPVAVTETAPEAAIMKEGAMPEKTAAEVAAIEAERDTAVKTAEATALELARYRAGEQANPVIAKALAESTLPAPAQARVRAQFTAAVLPLTESTRTLNTDALSTRVAAAITAEADYVALILESAGAGAVRGAGAAQGAGSGIPASFGAVHTTTAEADDAVTEALVKEYIARGLPEAAARRSAAGRN